MRYATASTRAVQAGASGPLRSTSNKHKVFWVPNHPILSSPLASQPTPLSGGQLVLGIRQRVTQLLLWSVCFRPGVLWFGIHSSRTILTHYGPLSLPRDCDGGPV